MLVQVGQGRDGVRPRADWCVAGAHQGRWGAVTAGAALRGPSAYKEVLERAGVLVLSEMTSPRITY